MNFTIINLETVGGELLLEISINERIAFFKSSFPVSGSISFGGELELLMRQPDFDYHREFLKVVSDYLKGAKINFPVRLSASAK